MGGQAENAVIEQKVNRVSIFRPGTLARDGNSNSSLDVRILAAVMVYDAECDDIEDKNPVYYYSDMINYMTQVAVKRFDEICVGDKKENDDNDDHDNDGDEVKEEVKKDVDIKVKEEQEQDKNENGEQNIENKDDKQKKDEIVDKPIDKEDVEKDD